MSILVVEALPDGIVFAADRNVTTSVPDPGNPSVHVPIGQTPRRKVFRWPNGRAVLGYVGEATIGGKPNDVWFQDYIDGHQGFDSFSSLAQDLSRTVQHQRTIDEGPAAASPLLIHLAGFEPRGGIDLPTIWFIRNAYGIDRTGYVDFRKQFQCDEQFWQDRYFGRVPPDQVRETLRQLCAEHRPFWFHQGLDLGTFNTLKTFLQGAFGLLCRDHPGHSFPQTLADWEKHLKMAVLTYGAYYEAFMGSTEQFVGGGVDVVSVEWPAG